MICKDDEICTDCFLRRERKDCGHEPVGYGPDIDNEYSVGCDGAVTQITLSDSYLMDSLWDYNGIGDPIPWDLLYPIFVWSGFNWLENSLNFPESIFWLLESKEEQS